MCRVCSDDGTLLREERGTGSKEVRKHLSILSICLSIFLLSIYLSIIDLYTYIHIHIHAFTVGICVGMSVHLCKRPGEDFWESVLSFYHVGLGVKLRSSTW